MKLKSLKCSRKRIPKKLQEVASSLDRHIDTDFQLSVANMQRRWRYAKLQVKAYREDADFFRDIWLKDQAEAAAAAGKGKVEGILKCIRQHEKTRRLFRKLRAALSPKEFGGLMSLWVPSALEDGTVPPPELAMNWEVVTDPVTVETSIIEQSRKHFKQAQGTPFTVPPLDQIDGAGAPVVKEILQSGLPSKWREVTPVGWNSETSNFIDRLQSDDKVPKIDTEISMQDFVSGIKRWKEKTTTSPSGRHLGHLHVLLAPDGVINPKDQGEPTKEIEEKI